MRATVPGITPMLLRQPRGVHTMAPSTETPPGTSGTGTTRETQSPPRDRHALVAWAAVLVACIAVAAFAVATLTGGDDSDVPSTRPTPESEQVDRQAHLEGQARTRGLNRDTGGTTDEGETDLDVGPVDGATSDDGLPNPWAAGDAAAQEALDASDDPAGPAFLPGSRRVPAG
jgi:hypothetical protein